MCVWGGACMCHGLCVRVKGKMWVEFSYFHPLALNSVARLHSVFTCHTLLTLKSTPLPNFLKHRSVLEGNRQENRYYLIKMMMLLVLFGTILCLYVL